LGQDYALPTEQFSHQKNFLNCGCKDKTYFWFLQKNYLEFLYPLKQKHKTIPHIIYAGKGIKVITSNQSNHSATQRTDKP